MVGIFSVLQRHCTYQVMKEAGHNRRRMENGVTKHIPIQVNRIKIPSYKDCPVQAQNIADQLKRIESQGS